MKRSAKKILSLFLCAMLCVALLPAAAFAENETAETEPIAAELPEKAVRLPEETIPAEEPAAEKPAPAEAETATEPEPAAELEASDSGEESVAIDESNFPDAAFRTYLSENVDADADGLLSPQEINSVTSISCIGLGLTSLEGVALFPNLVTLDCASNQLTALDVSGNTALEYLDCGNNQLTALDVSGCPAMEYLYCFDNELTALDVSGCTALESLHCAGNQLTALDVSQNPALKDLYCNYNQLTELDVSGNTALQSLGCSYNQLTDLDVSRNTALQYLDCNSTQRTTLDVSGCTALESLHCVDNQLTALDVSQNPALQDLHCDYNQLTELDVSGNTALQSLGCDYNQLTDLDVSRNTALQGLYCSYNQLTALDVSSNTALQYLDCENNQLTTLDVSSNTALQNLACSYNLLTALDVSGCASLTELDCTNNRLTALDLSNNAKLNSVLCSGQSVSVPGFTQSGEKYLFDLSTLVGAENTGKITSVENGDYDAETGIASFAGICSFTYYYTTGYGETLMDVSCVYESSPVPDENGNYHITSFAELKALLAEGLTGYTTIIYEGTESFVFEEDLTLPENTCFITQVDTIVPSGVTVTVNGTLSDWDGTLYVEGTLVAKNGIDLQNIDVSGSLTTYGDISIPSTGTIKGDENITFAEGNYGTGGFYIGYNVSTIDEFKAAVQETNLNKPNRRYSISLSTNDTVTVEEELTLGANTYLSVYSPFVVAENGTLSVDNNLFIASAVTINGSLINSGMINIWDGALSLGETGSYSGTGEISIDTDKFSSPDEAIPGFTLSDFDITNYSWGWILRYVAGLEKLTTPVDLRVGTDYVYNYDENGNATGYQAVEAPGMLSWRVEGLTQNQFNVSIYMAGEEMPVWQTGWYFGADEKSAFAVSDFIRIDPESGEYYFTVTALSDSTQYRSSDTAVSETWTYVKPELSLGQCSKPVVDGQNVSFLFPEDLSYVGGEIMEIYYSPTADMADAMQVGESFYTDNEAVSQREGISYIYDYAIQTGGTGYYSVRVRALSCNINAACNGPWSEMSDPVYISDVEDSVDAILQGIEEGTVDPTAETVREQVQGLDTESLRTAMLADNDDSGVNSSLQALEAYTGGTVVEVTDAMAGSFDAETVGVIGASLNTVQDSEQPVKLIVDQAKEDDVIPELYDNTVAVRFALELENVDSTQLEVPVKVTLPIPASINPDFLVILHYHVTGEAPEEIWPYVFQQDGQYYASFVVTSFSDFVMTVPATEETLPGDANGDGVVNTMDLIRLMKYISGVEVDVAEGAGDVNGDGKVNTMDLIRLMKIINGESV